MPGMQRPIDQLADWELSRQGEFLKQKLHGSVDPDRAVGYQAQLDAVVNELQNRLARRRHTAAVRSAMP